MLQQLLTLQGFALYVLVSAGIIVPLLIIIWADKRSKMKRGLRAGRITIPRFAKDVDMRGTFALDIRQILSDNPIKDPQAKQDGAEHEYAIELLDVIGFNPRHETGGMGVFPIFFDPRHETEGMEVCPIFRDREQQGLIIFPPFRLNGERVVGGRVGSSGEFVVLASMGRIIEIKTPFPAKPGFVLWADENLAPHYELRLH